MVAARRGVLARRCISHAHGDPARAAQTTACLGHRGGARCDCWSGVAVLRGGR